jgi:phosphate transport system protein
MGRLGTEMWQITADAWSTRDLAAIAAVSRRDDEMDELRAALVAEVARGSVEIPLAMDMALVARFYERLGDHAVNGGERVRSLAVAPPAPDGLGAVAGGAAG